MTAYKIGNQLRGYYEFDCDGSIADAWAMGCAYVNQKFPSEGVAGRCMELYRKRVVVPIRTVEYDADISGFYTPSRTPPTKDTPTDDWELVVEGFSKRALEGN